MEQGRPDVRPASTLSRSTTAPVEGGGTPSSAHRRGLTVQATVLATVLAVGAYLGYNAIHNLQVRGIATGFGFLSSEAGFGIIQHLLPYDETSTYGRVFLVGLLNTLLVSGLGILFATALGFIIGIARLSSNGLVARLAGLYIEIFRNVPLLLQIFFWYFGVLRFLPAPRKSLVVGDLVFLNIRGIYLPRPVATEATLAFLAAVGAAVTAALLVSHAGRRRRRKTGQGLPTVRVAMALLTLLPALSVLVAGRPFSLEAPVLAGFNFRGGVVVLPELAALLVALSIYTAAFIAEVVRAGIQSVDRGQTEAARSLGLRRGLVLRLVVIPQAWRVILPPLANQYLNLTKNSSLAAAIGYPDLVSVFAGSALNQTGQAIEVIAITMAVYLALSLVIASVINRYNRRVAAFGETA